MFRNNSYCKTSIWILYYIIGKRKSPKFGNKQDTTLRIQEGISSWQEALFPHVLPYRYSKIRRSFIGQGKCANRNNLLINYLCEAFPPKKYRKFENPFRLWPQSYYGLLKGRNHRNYHQTKQTEPKQVLDCLDTKRVDIQKFFIYIDIRYKRIRKRSKEISLPQPNKCKKRKLQVIENLKKDDQMMLFFADESYICAEGYVLYGWQMSEEKVLVFLLKDLRLNIFGMINRNNDYNIFTFAEQMMTWRTVRNISDFFWGIHENMFTMFNSTTVYKKMVDEET
ncbi:hypothetical protein [Porphyromonas gingivalis]|uniref:Transposase n=1 Tax=Porphyromonas gingivalis TaxID=837 RepID=A0AAE9XBW3_PORGN|nr:hypothetical protein [Porphyromonas gingivalis]WCF98152.1 hypothetical protein NY149_06380 [Porphyromonas gingivalis]